MISRDSASRQLFLAAHHLPTHHPHGSPSGVTEIPSDEVAFAAANSAAVSRVELLSGEDRLAYSNSHCASATAGGNRIDGTAEVNDLTVDQGNPIGEPEHQWAADAGAYGSSLTVIPNRCSFAIQVSSPLRYIHCMSFPDFVSYFVMRGSVCVPVSIS